MTSEEFKELQIGNLKVGKNQIYFDKSAVCFVVEEFEFTDAKGNDMFSVVDGFTTFEKSLEAAKNPQKYMREARKGIYTE